MPSDFSHAHDEHERARHCVTHHDACDCGKARHLAEIARLTAERDAARAECWAWRQFDRAMLRDPQVAGECLREARVRGEANPMPEAP